MDMDYKMLYNPKKQAVHSELSYLIAEMDGGSIIRLLAKDGTGLTQKYFGGCFCVDEIKDKLRLGYYYLLNTALSTDPLGE